MFTHGFNNDLFLERTLLILAQLIVLNVLTQAQLVLLECTFCVFLKSILTAIEHNLSGPSYCIIPSLHGRLPAGVIALRSR